MPRAATPCAVGCTLCFKGHHGVKGSHDSSDVSEPELQVEQLHRLLMQGQLIREAMLSWCRSWEGDALTAFEGGCGDAILQCGLSAEDVLSLGLLGNSAPEAGTHRGDVLPVAATEQLPREPQLYRSSSEQTHVGSANSLGATGQPMAPRRDSSCLLEEALTSIGMRQLLPQISMPQDSLDFSFGHMQASALLPPSTYMPYASGAASVFVPCTNPQPLPVHSFLPNALILFMYACLLET